MILHEGFVTWIRSSRPHAKIWDVEMSLTLVGSLSVGIISCCQTLFSMAVKDLLEKQGTASWTVGLP